MPNTIRFIPFLFALFVANMQIGSYDNMTTFIEILIFFFWMGYNFFLKIYYERCIIEFSEKYEEEFQNKRFDLIFKNMKKEEFDNLNADYLELGKQKLPRFVYKKMYTLIKLNSYSKFRKFLLIIDDFLPITILILFLIMY